MATGTFSGTNYAVAVAHTPATSINGALWNGTLHIMVDEVFASGTALDAGSTMNCGVLPKGAIPLYTRITPIAATGIATAMSNAVTGTVGIKALNSDSTITTDANYLGAFTTLAAVGAATQTLIKIPDGTIYTGMTALVGDAIVYITTADAALTAAEGVRIEVVYCMLG